MGFCFLQVYPVDAYLYLFHLQVLENANLKKSMYVVCNGENIAKLKLNGSSHHWLPGKKENAQWRENLSLLNHK